MESRRDDFRTRLEEVVTVLDTPTGIGDRIVGGSVGRGRGDRLGRKSVFVVLVVGIDTVDLGSPSEARSIPRDSVDLQRLDQEESKEEER